MSYTDNLLSKTRFSLTLSASLSPDIANLPERVKIIPHLVARTDSAAEYLVSVGAADFSGAGRTRWSPGVGSEYNSCLLFVQLSVENLHHLPPLEQFFRTRSFVETNDI